LAAYRDPESYAAGASAFEPRRGALAATADAQTVEAAGYAVRWVRREPAIYTAEVTGPSGATHLEWVIDGEFRFFPVMRDDTFGYVLHPVDLATNKVMAAAGRRELRDIVDVVMVHEAILPLGAVVWAAVEKAPGYTPEGLRSY
jgi:hypothetical protein